MAMKRIPSYLLPFLLLVGVFTSCRQQQSLSESSDSDTLTTASIFDYDIYFDKERFFIKTIESGLKLQTAWALALDRAACDSIRAVAPIWKERHEKGVQKIAEVGTEMQIDIPQEMNRTDTQQILDLATQYSEEFDGRFIKMIIEDYERSIPLFEQAALDANNGDIRLVATAMLPQLYEQLAQARIIAQVSFRN